MDTCCAPVRICFVEYRLFVCMCSVDTFYYVESKVLLSSDIYNSVVKSDSSQCYQLTAHIVVNRTSLSAALVLVMQ